MSEPQYRTVTTFDRIRGGMENLPDVTRCGPSTIQTVHPLIGEVQTFIVETLRQRERGDTIFLIYVEGDKSIRIPIPPQVADTIARQREALGKKVRREIGRRLGKQQAAERKARGEPPAFMKGKKKSKGE